MSDNWLSTAGSWLATPAKALFGPWWEKYVGGKAETIAVRKKILEAAVLFRVRDFCKLHNLDSDKELAISRRIIERLTPGVVGNDTLDVTSPAFLRCIEDEVHFHGIPQSAWMQLACLAETGDFNPNDTIVVEYVDEKGSHSHRSAIIVSLQSTFPFWELLQLQSMTLSRLSAKAIEGLRAYANRHDFPEVRYEIVPHMPQPGQPLGTHCLILPPNWKPQSK